MTSAEELIQRVEKLKILFPDDQRLREGVMQAWGATDQIPVLNETFRKALLAFPDKPEPEDILSWESVVNITLGDVLRWCATLELALHDLRSSLFFRYQRRVNQTHVPRTPEEERKALDDAAERVDRDAARAKAAAGVTGKSTGPTKDGPPAPPPAARIAGLFAGKS